MRDWSSVFSSYVHSGVYMMKPGEDYGEVKKTATSAGLEYIEVDLKGVGGKTALLRWLAAALNFPITFGMNWDALNDCLADMSWRPAPGYAIVLKKYSSFAEKQPETARTAHGIFESATVAWKQRSVPFYIILS